MPLARPSGAWGGIAQAAGRDSREAKRRGDRYQPMPLLDSEALLAVHYDAARQTLRATFRGNRRTYDYLGVPAEDYAALLRTDSKGVWFNAHIRDRYPFHEAD